MFIQKFWSSLNFWLLWNYFILTDISFRFIPFAFALYLLLLVDENLRLNERQGNAANSSETSMATQPGGSVTSRAASESRSGPPGSSSGATGNSSGSTVTGAKFRHGLLQLMIHTIDPLHDGEFVVHSKFCCVFDVVYLLLIPFTFSPVKYPLFNVW